MYFASASDLVDRSRLSDTEVQQCLDVMRALHEWREAERVLEEAMQSYMDLGENDMRAIRLLIRARDQEQLMTPKDVARGVGISSASTTKMIDRLEAGGHVVRAPHPRDRRTLCITVTEGTRISARESVGRQHARRFDVAAGMAEDERAVVVRFLRNLAEADAPTGVLRPDDPA